MTTIHTDCEQSFVAAAGLMDSGLENADNRRAPRMGHPFHEAEAAEIVHDFKNTLAAVTMLSDLMLRELPAGSPTRRMARDVRMACKDALALCKRMLASFRAVNNVREQIDLSNTVTRLTPLLATWVPPGSALRFDLAADLPLLDFAAGAMPQIVMNLVKNAAEALGDRPGAVTVGTGWIELDATDLQEENGLAALALGRHVCLTVSDTGCGIDEQTRSRLLEGAFTTKANGNGLGLASVRRIAAAHRAGILLESQIGAGTTVSVVFADGPPLVSTHPCPPRSIRNELVGSRWSIKSSSARPAP